MQTNGATTRVLTTTTTMHYFTTILVHDHRKPQPRSYLLVLDAAKSTAVGISIVQHRNRRQRAHHTRLRLILRFLGLEQPRSRCTQTLLLLRPSKFQRATACRLGLPHSCCVGLESVQECEWCGFLCHRLCDRPRSLQRLHRRRNRRSYRRGHVRRDLPPRCPTSVRDSA